MTFSLSNIRAAVGKLFSGSAATGSFLWNWAIPGEWGKEDLIKQYVRVVYSVVSAIAEEAAKIDFEVKRGDTVVKTHPFIDLMKRPNPDYSQFQFLEFHFTFMEVCGESFWYLPKGVRTKQVKEMYLIPPHLMDVSIDDADETGLVKGYILNKPDGKKIPFDKNEILHFKLPNLRNPYRGLGPVEAGKTYIETESYSSEWTKNAIFNSGRPSGIVNFKGVVNADAYNAAKRQFKEMYGGIKNAGKILFTRGNDGLEFQKIGMELQELALKELKEMTRDDIMMMFRVSKTMLGISEGVTLNNARESREMFKENVIHNKWDRLNDHLAAFLMPMFGGTETLSYKDNVYKTVEQDLAEDVASVDKWSTKNEIRKKRGLKPLDGADVIYQPLNLVPLLAESADPPEPTPATTPAQDPNAAPKEDPNNPGMDMNGKPMPKDKPKEPPAGKGVKKKDVRQLKAEVFKETLFSNATQWEKKYQSMLVKEFQTQEREILKKHTKGAFPSWEFNVDASQERIVSQLVPMGMELMKAAAAIALEMADDSDTQFEISTKIREYVVSRVSQMALAVNDDTIKAIETTISDGIAAGESVGQLKNRLKDVYSEATSFRAERIARTESLAASNEGSLEAYKQSPVVNAKEWSAEANACEFCLELDGKTVALDEDFAAFGQSVDGKEGGKYQANYESIEHPPLHPNCRCALLPVAG